MSSRSTKKNGKRVSSSKKSPTPKKSKHKGQRKANLTLKKLSNYSKGSLVIGDKNSDGGVSTMVFGKAPDIHLASVQSQARQFDVSDDNWFLQGARPPAHQGGTVISHKLTFDLPCMNGTWHVASLHNVQRAGVMLWHAGLVGESCADAALLVETLEREGGEIFSVPRTARELGVLSVDRYDWTWMYDGDDERAALPAALRFEFEHGDVLGSSVGEQFHFLPPQVYLEQVWPWAKRAAAADGAGDFADGNADTAPVKPATIRDGIHLLRTAAGGDVPVGLLSALAAEYAFARVWLHTDDSGQRVGAKAILWFTYNVSDVFAGHWIGDAVIAGPKTDEERAQMDEAEDPSWQPQDAVDDEEQRDAEDDSELSDANVSGDELQALVAEALLPVHASANLSE